MPSAQSECEVLDESGKPLASATVSGDSVQHLVQFNGKSLGQVAPPRPVRLRFEVRPTGRLYSFR